MTVPLGSEQRYIQTAALVFSATGDRQAVRDALREQYGWLSGAENYRYTRLGEQASRYAAAVESGDASAAASFAASQPALPSGERWVTARVELQGSPQQPNAPTPDPIYRTIRVTIPAGYTPEEIDAFVAGVAASLAGTSQGEIITIEYLSIIGGV